MRLRRVCYPQFLIDKGQYGIAMNNGSPEIFFAGRHVLLSPLSSLVSTQSIGSNLIQVGPVSIVRIQQGQFGLAQNNHMFEILLPGTIVYLLPCECLLRICLFILVCIMCLVVRSSSHGVLERSLRLLLCLSPYPPFSALCFVDHSGLHARQDAAWTFKQTVTTDSNLISLGPVKIFIVKSGCVQVCFNNGKVRTTGRSMTNHTSQPSSMVFYP
jgi:hypothetical protein